MDTEVAWSNFKKSRAEDLHSASVSGKLDTIAAQLQEISVNSKRTAELVPRILGDEGALDIAGAGTPPDMGIGADPNMGGVPPIEDPGMMPPDGGTEPDAEMGSEPISDTNDLGAAEGEQAEGLTDEPVLGSKDIVPPQGVNGGPTVPDEILDDPTTDILGEGDTAPAVDVPLTLDEGVGGLGPELGLEAPNPYESDPSFIEDPFMGQDPGLFEDEPYFGDDLGSDPSIAYARLADTLKDATRRALGLGDVDLVSQLADSLVVIDQMFKSDVCPVLDRIYGTDRFTGSVGRPLKKSEDDMMSENEIVKADDEKRSEGEEPKDDEKNETSETKTESSESEGDSTNETEDEGNMPEMKSEMESEVPPPATPPIEEIVAMLAQLPEELLGEAMRMKAQMGASAPVPGAEDMSAPVDTPVPTGASGVPEATLPPVVGDDFADAAMKSEKVVDCEAVDVPEAEKTEGTHGTGGDVSTGGSEIAKGEGGLAGVAEASEATGDVAEASDVPEPMDKAEDCDEPMMKSDGIFSSRFKARMDQVNSTTWTPGMSTLAKGEGVATFGGEPLCKSQDQLNSIFSNSVFKSYEDVARTCNKPKMNENKEGTRGQGAIVKPDKMMKAIDPSLSARDLVGHDMLTYNDPNPMGKLTPDEYYELAQVRSNPSVSDIAESNAQIWNDPRYNEGDSEHPELSIEDMEMNRNADPAYLGKSDDAVKDGLTTEVDAAEDLSPTDSREFTGTINDVSPIDTSGLAKSIDFGSRYNAARDAHVSAMGGIVPTAPASKSAMAANPAGSIYGASPMVKSGGQTRQIQSMMGMNQMRKSSGMDSASADRAGFAATMSGALARPKLETTLESAGMSIRDRMAVRRGY